MKKFQKTIDQGVTETDGDQSNNLINGWRRNF